MAHNLRHDTLVSVTTGHFVTHLDLTFLGDVDLRNLHNAGRQLVAHGEVELLSPKLRIQLLVFLEVIHDQLLD